jgi:hypothetical protein
MFTSSVKFGSDAAKNAIEISQRDTGSACGILISLDGGNFFSLRTVYNPVSERIGR